MTPLQIDRARVRYRAMIGVGGLGSGIFFALDGPHTLGREESRSGRLLDRRDYCKLHIVSHYVQRLLGSSLRVLPIGKVGSDEIGGRLLEEMREAGLDLTYVERADGSQTLFSICLVYPDGSGGNLTSNDSACATVTETTVEGAERDIARYRGRGIALALPEVPLPARFRLLDLGAEYALWRVASFTSTEIREMTQEGRWPGMDLLAINLDEAAALVRETPEDQDPEAIVEATVSVMTHRCPGMQLSITGGGQGSWCWDGTALHHTPAFPVHPVSTAGAGDAHLAGVIAGVTAGLSLVEAQELGALTAALSVTSPHTIHKGIDRDALRAFATSAPQPLSDEVGTLLAP